MLLLSLLLLKLYQGVLPSSKIPQSSIIWSNERAKTNGAESMVQSAIKIATQPTLLAAIS